MTGYLVAFGVVMLPIVLAIPSAIMDDVERRRMRRTAKRTIDLGVADWYRRFPCAACGGGVCRECRATGVTGRANAR